MARATEGVRSTTVTWYLSRHPPRSSSRSAADGMQRQPPADKVLRRLSHATSKAYDEKSNTRELSVMPKASRWYAIAA